VKGVAIMAVALVACGGSNKGPILDATGNEGDGSVARDSGGSDANSDGDIDGATPYICSSTILGNGCCVFDQSACGAPASGFVCQYAYTLDNSTQTSPDQGAGWCHGHGTLALGAACNTDTVLVPADPDPTCGFGAWCAYDANTSPLTTPDHQGHCRQLCDPLDQAAHGCLTGTCVGMLYCTIWPGALPSASTTPGEWPNCVSASNTHLGFCQ
jgi:hypothetical protein